MTYHNSPVTCSTRSRPRNNCGPHVDEHGPAASGRLRDGLGIARTNRERAACPAWYSSPSFRDLLGRGNHAMLYRSGAGLMIIASAVALLLGMWRLFAERKWAIITRYLVAFAVYVWLWRAVDKVENPDLRLWLAMPLIFMIPVWLLSGFLVYRASEGLGLFKPVPNQFYDATPSRLAKLMGAVGIVWGIGCFIYGVVNTPIVGSTASLWLIVLTYLPFVYGISTLPSKR